MISLDHPLFSRRVFHPRVAALEPSVLVDVDGAQVACYVHRKYRNAWTILHFHGNGELASEYSAHFPDLFLNLGLNVIFAEYRGYGRSSGHPGLTAMLGDGERIVETLGLDPERLIVFGRSLGSVYAIELAQRLPKLAGLVIESGLADLLELWKISAEDCITGLTAAELAREAAIYFDHRRKMGAYRGRVLVLHAEQDRLVTVSHAERLHDWSAAAKKLVLFPFGDHNSILFANQDAYVSELKAFVQSTGLQEAGKV